MSEFESFNSDVVGDITVTDLYQGADEISLKKPLIVALAKTNKPDASDDDSDADIDARFDEAVCDVAEKCYEEAGLESAPVPSRMLRAILLQAVRGLSNYGSLAEYIDGYERETLAQFGLKQAYDRSMYRKARNTLEADASAGVVAEAAIIAVHALFGNGVPVPDSVLSAYNLSYEMGPVAGEFPDGGREIALYSMVDDLLEIVVEHLDFDRAANKSRELRSLIGAFAWSAMDEQSVDTYHYRARQKHDLSSSLKGPTIRGHIESLKLYEVNEIFDNINQALLGYVIESEGISAPTMSYDLTKLSIPVPEPDSHPYRTEDGKWRVAGLSVTDPDLEFAVGMRVLKGESARADKLKTLLGNLAAHTDVGLLMTDRGFDGEDDIVACRTHDGDWMIFAQDYSDSYSESGEDRGRDFKRLREKLEPGKTAIVEDTGYQNLANPVNLIGYSGATEDDETIDPIRAFYTDMLPGEESVDDTGEEFTQDEAIQELNFTYNQRAKIEGQFRMMKNDLSVATYSAETVKQTFYTNISVLFYNIYQIVNTVPAPNNGLELDISQKELLNVIQNLTLGPPREPAAQQALNEQS